MKVIIFGSRHMPFSMYPLIQQAVDKSGFNVTEVVCGMARGADTFGAKWAYHAGIPIKRFPAKWRHDGNTVVDREAGLRRNKQMGDYADAGIGFMWDGSRGTQHMMNYLKHLNKPCFMVYNGEIDYAF